MRKIKFFKIQYDDFFNHSIPLGKMVSSCKNEKNRKKLVSDGWKNFLLIEKLYEKGIKIQCRWMKKIKN